MKAAERLREIAYRKRDAREIEHAHKYLGGFTPLHHYRATRTHDIQGVESEYEIVEGEVGVGSPYFGNALSIKARHKLTGEEEYRDNWFLDRSREYFTYIGPPADAVREEEE